MQLVSFHVRMFRNVLDSGDIVVDGPTICLVGKNEAGKSALLEALHHVSPANTPPSPLDIDLDYPRWLRKPHELEDRLAVDPVVTATYRLDDDEVAAMAEAFGVFPIKSREVTLERRYGKDSELVDSCDYPGWVGWFCDTHTAAPLTEPVGRPQNSTELRKKLVELAKERQEGADGTSKPTAVAAGADRALEVMDGLLGEGANLRAAVGAHLKERFPKTFFFSKYSQLSGLYDLARVLPHVHGEDSSGDEDVDTAAAFLRIARVDVERLNDMDYVKLNAELEAVSNMLTNEVNQYWRQNEHLRLRVDTFNRPKGNGQAGVEKDLRFQVEDTRHNFTNNLDRRSTGFRWFVSFVAAFFEFKKDANLIVLLDEPGLSLHARAQMDLLDAIEERLSESRQVLYSTHSPFMVRPTGLDRVRIVEDGGPDAGSGVRDDVLATDRDTLFPLQAALGYDIAQNLFVGDRNLVVEGVSDFVYLTVVSEHLASLGRASLDPAIRVLPAGGATNIPAFVALMGVHLGVVVLLDGNSDRQRLDRLAESGLLRVDDIITLSAFSPVKGADVEDLFTPGEYLSLYNATFETQHKVADLDGSDRIVARLSRIEGSKFEQHARVALDFARNASGTLNKLSAGTLDRFENVIKTINGRLAVNERADG